MGGVEEKATKRQRSSGRTTQHHSQTQASRAERKRRHGAEWNEMDTGSGGSDETGQHGKRSQVLWEIQLLGRRRNSETDC